MAAEGATFINALADCPLGWRHEPRIGARVSRLAVETRYWPLYEVADGRYRLTYEPPERVPIDEWLRPQGRFKHLLTPGHETELAEIQARVDADWDELVAHCRADEAVEAAAPRPEPSCNGSSVGLRRTVCVFGEMHDQNGDRTELQDVVADAAKQQSPDLSAAA